MYPQISWELDFDPLGFRVQPLGATEVKVK